MQTIAKFLADIGKWFGGVKWPRPNRRVLAYVAAGTLAVLAGSVLLIYGVLKAVEPALPRDADLYALNRPQAYTFLDENGAKIGVRGAIVGERLKLSEMPPYLPAAFLAMEDRKFYRHHGVDPEGLLRAVWIDMTEGHLAQGGSTITQQVVKILLLTPDRTFSRKLQEIAGAFELEHRLTKDQILELYLNRIYLGSGAYGVDGAARLYFGKSARNVTLPEAAMLAALTSAPSTFSPRHDLSVAQSRADIVLSALVATGAIKKPDAAQALMHPATITDPARELGAGYFLDAATEEAKNLLPGATGDMIILTTMDQGMQQAGRTAIRNVLNRSGARSHASQAALVAMTPDGAIRALIGGRDYADSTFDRAITAHRQPGSAFKPFVYLAALESGLRPNTVRIDQPVSIKNWSPDNYSQSYIGPVTLQDALANSINSVAVQLGQEVGMQSVIAVARRLGISSPLEPNASLALGTSEVAPLELTASYASFASLGMRATPYLIREIRGPDGALLYRRETPRPARIVTEDNALMMNSMLYQVVQSGTGRAAAVPGHEVAGKTGTSADYHDAWFVGFSSDLVAGVWVGNDDSSPMKQVTGGSLPAQIWSGFMRVALQNSSDLPLPRTEPVPPADTDNDADNANTDDNLVERSVDGVGRFFQRLFNGDPAPRPLRRSDDRFTRDDRPNNDDARNTYANGNSGPPDDDTDANDSTYRNRPPPGADAGGYAPFAPR